MNVKFNGLIHFIFNYKIKVLWFCCTKACLVKSDIYELSDFIMCVKAPLCYTLNTFLPYLDVYIGDNARL